MYLICLCLRNSDTYICISHQFVLLNSSQSNNLQPFGFGCQDAKALTKASIDAGARWLIIEQDECSAGQSPLEAAKMSIDTLKRLIAEGNY